ncbi:hypothetical protein [Robiginitalea sediminis]|uniref:hypothetical protein n=1 Tax=Robiginitalea sediminis TaxID=1982593 RepID=UPI000B4AB258|nr:hypothetical protein [Robiginitalea sediminis]
MKTYPIYRSIRKRALIFGLPVSLFALQMVAVIGSLLVIIFSFSLGVILGGLLVNLGLYAGLLRFNRNPQLVTLQKVYPESISNQQSTGLCYERD